MAELVLGKAGAAIGSALLPKGVSFLGGAIGSLVGAAIDARFLSAPREGPRVSEFHLTEGREGAGIPLIYGRCRVGGQLIWAAAFKERREVEGGKGGPRVADYSYTLSFALALCEGEVARISRCWANGEPFDLSKVTWRLHRGTEDQLADPLIEAIEIDGAPAYRGTAYIVFEDMPVDAFGARMPQMSFEVIRPAGGGADRLENVARAVNMIPGSGEFALATSLVRRRGGPGREVAENLHGAELRSDFEASLDQLEAELPKVSRVNLVVAWFGDDLRCGECAIRPGVETDDKVTVPQTWSVASIARDDAYVVSSMDGRLNYGGTPSDESVRQAVAMLKARGYHVTLYPFLLMDIPLDNGLPDPAGGEEQPAFPWRGRLATTDGDEAEQITAFFEQYRTFILHYAALAEETNADGLLIGSELVALTRTQVDGVHPAVEALCELAADVRSIVGDGAEISYAADWTEYGGLVDGDDLSFPLDALWAHPAISYVGVDWYPPMADWRDGDEHTDAAFGDGRSRSYLAANVAGGEAFDWHYADEPARLAQDRLAITDGVHGEPFVFRQKDIAGWWANAHHPRVGGVRSATPTDWTPGMKPVRFIEMGVPAVDKGANQPNVFYDPKSSESALPHFSNGSRDDLVQRRAVEAFHAHWADDANNPVSEVYDGRMLPDDGIALWAWDARPFPSFPAREDVWGDAGNWRLGHWLNGRVGLALLPEVVEDICDRARADADVSRLTGLVTGFSLSRPASARTALDQLAQAYGIDATERDGKIVFRMCGAESFPIDAGRLIEEDAPAPAIVRSGLEDPAPGVRLIFIDAEGDHAPGIAATIVEPGADSVEVHSAVVLDRGQAQGVAETLASQKAMERQKALFAMAADGVAVEPGDVVILEGTPWRVVEVADSGIVRFEGVLAGPAASAVLTPAIPVALPAASTPLEPEVVIVDGPPLPGEENDLRPIGFAFASPWTGPIAFSAGADPTLLTGRGTVQRPCMMGRLVSALYPHVSGRWQETSLWVNVSGNLASRTEAAVLNGANAALVETGSSWELIQFLAAELVDTDTWKLTGLLRGQQGSEHAMAAGADEEARIVFLTGAETRLDVSSWERGLELIWRASRETVGDNAAWSDAQTYHAVADRMWSPAHLGAGWDDSDIVLDWVRRARIGGDAWIAGEPPHETTEAYRVRVSGGMATREWDVTEPTAAYSASNQATDFPSGGSALIEVAQLGKDGEPGAWAGLELTIPGP